MRNKGAAVDGPQTLFATPVPASVTADAEERKVADDALVAAVVRRHGQLFYGGGAAVLIVTTLCLLLFAVVSPRGDSAVGSWFALLSLVLGIGIVALTIRARRRNWARLRGARMWDSQGRSAVSAAQQQIRRLNHAAFVAFVAFPETFHLLVIVTGARAHSPLAVGLALVTATAGVVTYVSRRRVIYAGE